MTQYYMTHRFSSIINKDNDLYIALCPELDIASQGETVEDALRSLKKAIELYLEDENTTYA
jgi:predicted RNase H-like HicB family nuclease